jgi:hypothetical protein
VASSGRKRAKESSRLARRVRASARSSSVNMRRSSAASLRWATRARPSSRIVARSARVTSRSRAIRSRQRLASRAPSVAPPVPRCASFADAGRRRGSEDDRPAPRSDHRRPGGAYTLATGREPDRRRRVGPTPDAANEGSAKQAVAASSNATVFPSGGNQSVDRAPWRPGKENDSRAASLVFRLHAGTACCESSCHRWFRGFSS